jgi:MFS family permease
MARPSSWLLLALKQRVRSISSLWPVAAQEWTRGKAYGFFSLRITFLLALFLSEIGSLICGVAPSSVVLIVGRAIAGLAAAGLDTGRSPLLPSMRRRRKDPSPQG